MKKFELLAASAIAMLAATPALAQTAPQDAPATTATTTPQDTSTPDDIVITAQRQSETLQSVPIAVSAFSAANLAQQQIKTTSDLQLSLPNVTFTKSNFTSSSSFNIRGIGDLCVGVTCDAATAIHVNDVPVIGSPIFQNEYFDVERIEVLRGPQGTLFGRNATGGVINFITAKPDLTGIHAAGEAEYGNYKSIRVKGMLNIPLGDVFGVRIAGYYLNRDGFTHNLFTNTNIDGRNQYDIRASIRFQPSSSTTLDIVGHYFHENDDRSRVQKQLCHRDPTGILGCLPDRLANEQVNGDSTLAAVLTSKEFFIARGIPGALALGSVYPTDGDVYSGFTNPPGLRTVNIDSLPTFKTNEKQILATLSQDFGPKFNLKLDGGYTEGGTDSSVDYNIGIERSLAGNSGLNTLAFLAAGGGGAGLAAILGPVAAKLIPNGPNGNVCQSLAEPTGTGVYGGHAVCAPTSLDFDRSTAYGSQYFAEGIFSSKLDGPFNFLVGAGYLNYTVRDNSYYVNSFALDYASGILGSLSTSSPSYLATPFYRNDSEYYRLKSYGLFGEAYLNLASNLKLTAGLRYNHDAKHIEARTTFANCPVPIGTANAYNAANFACFDADGNAANGNQPLAINDVSFGRLTGRAVLDWQITSRNLLYASYSRGYKSGGINPPISPTLAIVPTTFGPETVNAFEVGSKNTFLDGQLRLNLTAFYYQYKSLQLSRIVARTSVNDNVDADIYGLEAEAVIRPIPALTINLNASYLHTKIATDKFLGNPQDPSGGRADAVIIKDISNGSNCAVVSNAGSAAVSNGFVNAANAAINAGVFKAQGFGGGSGLQGTTAIPGTNTTGAFSVCAILAGFQAATASPVTVLQSGVAVNVRGNELPQSPHAKFSAGVQYVAKFDDWNLTPRVDLSYTGGYYGSVFNGNISRIQGYAVVNAQIQLNAPSDKFYLRGFIQNLTNNNAITGLYVTDQSSGLFTNAFTLEPRRYGIAAGFKF
ncbi:MAG: TonB-dependent receptor [Sphingomonas sp.]|uniref:TonB-dependent receptor n=1 Tax=Sphingomonas sp. TaxID=28214 RepID=UPI001AC8CE64|nr:TonB-dependent receptor [Sphingomonas sp.]MBN8807623.1 TonB-dependent receptor [Sphingomonas sp.]